MITYFQCRGILSEMATAMFNWPARTARTRALFALCTLTLILLPLAVTKIPPLQDYPNHLARMHILSALGRNEHLQQMYAANWAFIPNLLMDLTVPPLSRVLPLEVAGRVFIALAMLVPILGTVALHRAWFGVWRTWPWIASLTAYNAMLAYGLLNYVVGIGLALAGAAWFALPRREPLLLGAVIGAGWGLICLLSHLIAFLVLLLLAGSTLVAHVIRGRKDMLPWQACSLLTMTLLPLGAYLALGPAANYARDVPLANLLTQVREHGLMASFARRMAWTMAGFASEGLGGALTVASAGFVFITASVAALRRRLRFAPEAILAAACLALGFLLLPDVFGDNAMMFQRLSLPLTLVGIAALSPEVTPIGRKIAVAAGVLLIAARGGAQAIDWSDQNRLLRDLREVIVGVEPGAMVLAVRDGSMPYFAELDEAGAQRNLRRAIAYMHLPVLLTLERDAFWPMVFAAPGKQPLKVKSPYDRLAQADGYLPMTSQLTPAADMSSSTIGCQEVPTELDRPPCHMWSWPQHYDYVLRLNSSDASPPDPRLGLLAASRFATLYHVMP
jgi:hypothetical protein